MSLSCYLDADSEGVEGKHYVWEDKELRRVLEKDYNLFAKYYDISENYDLEFKSTPEAREQMHKHKDFSMWKIHYCATFEGHGFSCIPIFQDLIPTMTLEQHDIITHQWTILRILN